MRTRGIITIFLICFLAGIAGGLLSRFFIPAPAAAQNSFQIVTANELVLFSGHKIAARWLGDQNSNGLFLFDPQGRGRLELNLFPDGRPVIALNDERHLCKFLMKLEWAPNIPMMFMKEPADRNRLIMALDLKKSDVPFLVVFDALGQPSEVFGKFEMP